MNKLLSVLALGSIVFFTGVSLGICDNLDDAGRSADSASSYASKAPYAKDVQDARTRSREVVSASSEARNAAIDARAYRAADYEDQANEYSRKAAGAKTGQDARFFSKQAAQAANEAQSSVDSDLTKRRAAARTK